MGSLGTSVSSLNDVLGGGLRCKQISGLLSRPSSCRNSPMLLPKALVGEMQPLNRSDDSYLSKFAASIESMQMNSDVFEKINSPVLFNTCRASISPDTRRERSWKDRLSAGFSDSDDNMISPMSPVSTGSTKFEYNSDDANLWVELTKIDVSPVLPQRKSRTFCESARHVLNKIDPNSLQRYQISPQPQDFQLYNGTQCTKDPYEQSVQFKFQYLIVTERLKVTVIKASNLLKGEKLNSDVTLYAEVCLMPGKLQKQISKPTKVSRNPVFDYIVYFRGISLFEMHQMCLRVKILAKERLLKTPRIVGEVTVSLDDFDLVSENILEESFNTRIGTRSGSRYGLRTTTVQ